MCIDEPFKIKINGMKQKVRFVGKQETLVEGDLIIHKENTEENMRYIKSSSGLSGIKCTAAVGDRPAQHPNFIYLRKVK